MKLFTSIFFTFIEFMFKQTLCFLTYYIELEERNDLQHNLFKMPPLLQKKWCGSN